MSLRARMGVAAGEEEQRGHQRRCRDVDDEIGDRCHFSLPLNGTLPSSSMGRFSRLCVSGLFRRRRISVSPVFQIVVFIRVVWL